MPTTNLQLAGCIITNDEGNLLLIHRSTDKCQQWEIPGGKVEAGEAPAETAEREIKEELGLLVHAGRLLGNREFIEDGRIMSYSWYQAAILCGEPTIMEPGTHDDWRYFSVAELAVIRNTLSPNLLNFLDHLATAPVMFAR